MSDYSDYKDKANEANDLLRQLDEALGSLDQLIGKARNDAAGITEVWKSPVAADVQAMFADMLKQASGLQDHLGSVMHHARDAIQQSEEEFARQQREKEQQ